MQDYDFLGQSSTGSGLTWWAVESVDGLAGVCHILHIFIYFQIY